jgi:hypothetical protein
MEKESDDFSRIGNFFRQQSKKRASPERRPSGFYTIIRYLKITMVKKLPFLIACVFIFLLPFGSRAFNMDGPTALEVEVNGVNPSCPGAEDGSVSAIPSGGVEPYEYEWSTGETSPSLNGLGQGIYFVTVTDANLSEAFGQVSLQKDSIKWEIEAIDETCLGSCDATAALINVTGGTPPYSYLWSDPAGTTSWAAENLCEGNYTVTITDINACSAVAAVEIILSPEGIWVMSSATDVTCFGDADGTAYVGAMTGTPPYSYVWSDPSIPPVKDPSDLGPGEYFVTVTDENGCTAKDSVTVTEPPLLEINLDVEDFECGSGGTGTITAMASGGTPPYGYSWGIGQNNPTISGLNTGEYAVTVTDDNNCSTIKVAEIKGANPEAGTLTITADSVCLLGGTAEISATPDSNAVIPPGYQLLYILTSDVAMIIEQTDTMPVFTVDTIGVFTIHTLVYDTSTLDISFVVPGQTPASEVNDLLVQGGGDICASLDVFGAKAEVVFCCEADAGTLTADTEACLGTDDLIISAIPDSNWTIPPAYQVLYVLTQGSGLVIIDTSTDPEFTVDEGGLFTIHTLVFDPNTLDPGIIQIGTTTGFEINELLIQGGGTICGALDVDGASIEVINPDPGSLKADSAQVCLVNGMAFLSATILDTANVPAGYEIAYALTSGPGLIIQQLGLEPQFTVTELGQYKIHTLIYDPATFDPGSIILGTTTGFELDELLVQGGGDICASLDVVGASQEVVICDGCIDIGNFVWYDFDGDGLQTGNDQGVDHFQVLLTTAGPDGQFGTDDDVIEDLQLTDEEGYYLFECVEPGEYVIVFNPMSVPDNYTFSLPDQGNNDELDSDADTLTGATPPFIVLDGQDDDLSFDAGLDIICIPLDDGGEVGYDQIVCEGITPDEIINLVTPGIGLADVEYLWMFTTLPGVPFDPNIWQIVPNSTDANYQPGPLTQTTFFIRCARYEGCEEYTGESNIVVIQVLPFDSEECMPIFSLVGGTSHPDDGYIALNWSVSELHDDFEFLVEKSGNSLDYDQVGKVMASEVDADGRFNFMDQAPRAGSNYYRIILRDSRGMTTSSGVSMVTYQMPKTRVYPNPFQNSLTLDTRRMIDQPVTISIYNMLGKPVHQKVHPGNDRLLEELDLDHLSEGVYFLELRYSETRTEVLRILKTSRK